jgi:hypothetical protein
MVLHPSNFEENNYKFWKAESLFEDSVFLYGEKNISKKYVKIMQNQ